MNFLFQYSNQTNTQLRHSLQTLKSFFLLKSLGISLSTRKTIYQKMNSDFEDLYKSMCRPHSLWKIKNKPVESSFTHQIAELVKKGHFLIEKNDKNTAVDAVSVPRTRLLVPVSGGIASMASVWWALNHPHVEVYFCHLVGLDEDLMDRQMLCLTCLCLYARTFEGLPVGASLSTLPGSSEPVRLSQQNHRMLVLPMPAISFVLDERITSSDGGGASERGNRRHPQTLALMYRQILNAAQAAQCSSIVWSFFDAEKQFIEALHPVFVGVHKHQNIFPFKNRNAAFAEFQKACIVSDRVYSQTVMPVKLVDSIAVSAPKKKQKKAAMSEQKQQQEMQQQVLQTNGAAIMPDMAQFIVTCQKRPAEKQAEPVNENTDSETAAEYLQRHSEQMKNRLPFDWCGKCRSCRPWIDAHAHCTAHSDRLVEKQFCVQYPLMHAYEQLLGSLAPKVLKKSPISSSALKLPGATAKRKRSIALEEEDDEIEDDEQDVFVEEEEEAEDDDKKAKDGEEEEDDGIPIGPEEEEAQKPDEEDGEDEDEKPDNDNEEDEDDDNEKQDDFDDDDDDEGLSSTDVASHDDHSAAES